MTKLFPVPFLLVVLVAAAQDSSPGGLKHLTVFPKGAVHSVQVEAREIVRGAEYPSVVQLTGEVRIKSPVCLPIGRNHAAVCDGYYTILRADSAEYHEGTGQLEAHGNVSISPLLHDGAKAK
jgi:lipopolysaccharide assembly outer membrane protein LptD (OstA)